MIFRTLCQRTLLLGEKLAAVFVDYSAAFDTVSHKFVDTALQEMGASNKVRAMFRAIYKAASAFTTVKGVDGEEVKSPSFPIRRGVVQGDVTFPLFFILALELLLRRHDDGSGFQFTWQKNVKFWNFFSLTSFLLKLRGNRAYII